MRKLTVAFIVSLALLAVAPAQAGIPDLYSGSWPAKLMPSNEALGTITWVPVSEEWGRGVLDQPWGGAPFTNCPAKGQTRFFLGRYGTGGKLIACTVGADGRRLHGRYDGQGGEFRPGSFDVAIVTSPSDDEQEFEGIYVEDGGITTEWCGELVASTRPDVLSPRIRALPSFGRTGKPARLRFSASDDRNMVRVQLTIRRAGKIVGSVTSALRRVDARPSWVLWRPRNGKRLRGTFALCARAWDRYGNVSARSCSTLRLK
jgi:hypothetical protein